ncbi:MAG: hypothetical protein U1F00_09170 [Rhodoferax sp.]
MPPVDPETAFVVRVATAALYALEVGLDALEVGDGFVEAGELLFDFGDDPACCIGGTGISRLRESLEAIWASWIAPCRLHARHRRADEADTKRSA